MKSFNTITKVALLALALSPISSAQTSETEVTRESQSAESNASMDNASPSAALPWRTFYSRYEAQRYARFLRSRGFCTNVFYDSSMGWWVVEYF